MRRVLYDQQARLIELCGVISFYRAPATGRHCRSVKPCLTCYVAQLTNVDISGIPFVGLLLDRRPIRDATFVLLALGAGFGVLTMLPSTAAQLIGIGILVLLRPLFYTFVSDFMAKVFG